MSENTGNIGAFGALVKKFENKQASKVTSEQINTVFESCAQNGAANVNVFATALSEQYNIEEKEIIDIISHIADNDDTKETITNKDIKEQEVYNKKAETIYESLDGWGTDEKTFNETLENLTPEELVEVMQSYNDLYETDKSFIQMIAADFSGATEKQIMEQITNKLYTAYEESPDSKIIDVICDELFNATTGQFGTNEHFVQGILIGSTYNGKTTQPTDKFVYELMTAYENKFGITLKSSIQGDFSNSIEKILVNKLDNAQAWHDKNSQYNLSQDDLIAQIDTEEQPLELQNRAWGVNILISNLNASIDDVVNQSNRDGIFSNAYAGSKNLFEFLGVSPNELDSAIENQQQMILELTDALEVGRDEFDKVFKEWTGIEYDEEKMIEYQEAYTDCMFASTMVNDAQVFFNEIESASNMEQIVNSYFDYYGVREASTYDDYNVATGKSETCEKDKKKTIDKLNNYLTDLYNNLEVDRNLFHVSSVQVVQNENGHYEVEVIKSADYYDPDKEMTCTETLPAETYSLSEAKNYINFIDWEANGGCTKPTVDPFIDEANEKIGKLFGITPAKYNKEYINSILDKAENFEQTVYQTKDMSSLLQTYTNYFGDEKTAVNELNAILAERYEANLAKDKNGNVISSVQIVSGKNGYELLLVENSKNKTISLNDANENYLCLEDLSGCRISVNKRYQEKAQGQLDIEQASPYEQLQYRYAKAKTEALGEGDKLDQLISKYCAEQESCINVASGAVQIAGFAIIVGTSLATGVGAVVAPWLSQAGTGLALFGMFGNNVANAVDGWTSVDGLSQEEGRALAKETFTELAYLATGAGVNTVAMKAQQLSANGLKGLSWLLEGGVDFSLSVLSDFMISGELNIGMNTFQAIMGMLTGSALARENMFNTQRMDLMNEVRPRSDVSTPRLSMDEAEIQMREWGWSDNDIRLFKLEYEMTSSGVIFDGALDRIANRAQAIDDAYALYKNGYDIDSLNSIIRDCDAPDKALSAIKRYADKGIDVGAYLRNADSIDVGVKLLDRISTAAETLNADKSGDYIRKMMEFKNPEKTLEIVETLAGNKKNKAYAETILSSDSSDTEGAFTTLNMLLDSTRQKILKGAVSKELVPGCDVDVVLNDISSRYINSRLEASGQKVSSANFDSILKSFKSGVNVDGLISSYRCNEIFDAITKADLTDSTKNTLMGFTHVESALNQAINLKNHGINVDRILSNSSSPEGALRVSSMLLDEGVNLNSYLSRVSDSNSLDKVLDDAISSVLSNKLGMSTTSLPAQAINAFKMGVNADNIKKVYDVTNGANTATADIYAELSGVDLATPDKIFRKISELSLSSENANKLLADNEFYNLISDAFKIKSKKIDNKTLDVNQLIASDNCAQNLSVTKMLLEQNAKTKGYIDTMRQTFGSQGVEKGLNTLVGDYLSTKNSKLVGDNLTMAADAFIRLGIDVTTRGDACVSILNSVNKLKNSTNILNLTEAKMYDLAVAFEGVEITSVARNANGDIVLKTSQGDFTYAIDGQNTSLTSSKNKYVLEYDDAGELSSYASSSYINGDWRLTKIFSCQDGRGAFNDPAFLNEISYDANGKIRSASYSHNGKLKIEQEYELARVVSTKIEGLTKNLWGNMDKHVRSGGEIKNGNISGGHIRDYYESIVGTTGFKFGDTTNTSATKVTDYTNPLTGKTGEAYRIEFEEKVGTDLSGNPIYERRAMYLTETEYSSDLAVFDTWTYKIDDAGNLTPYRTDGNGMIMPSQKTVISEEIWNTLDYERINGEKQPAYDGICGLDRTSSQGLYLFKTEVNGVDYYWQMPVNGGSCYPIVFDDMPKFAKEYFASVN